MAASAASLHQQHAFFGTRRPRPKLVLTPVATPRPNVSDLPERLSQGWEQQGRPSVWESMQRGAWQAGLSFLAALTLASGPAYAGEVLLGPARVVDGDTMQVAGTRIRMYGIDAPETAQSCRKSGKDYSCGLDAKAALEAKVGQAPVACEVKNKDLYGRSVAACYANSGAGGDLGAYLVENGYAVAYRQYSKEYIPLEEQAKAAKRGIWAGSFQEPAEWRKEHPRNRSSPAGATPAAVVAAVPIAGVTKLPAAAVPAAKMPPNPQCPIKGNINAKGERIYHVPGGKSYDATAIAVSEGERWFCSESEAVAAGWRAAKS
ncbi:hypothetical protein N2152v2_001241 [Parachlorella kessleri]